MHPTFAISYSDGTHIPLTWMHPRPCRSGGVKFRLNIDEVFVMADTTLVSTYRRIADILRSAQRAAIEVENAPDKRKRLRMFSSQEVASLLGVPHREVTTF